MCICIFCQWCKNEWQFILSSLVKTMKTKSDWKFESWHCIFLLLTKTLQAIGSARYNLQGAYYCDTSLLCGIILLPYRKSCQSATKEFLHRNYSNNRRKVIFMFKFVHWRFPVSVDRVRCRLVSADACHFIRKKKNLRNNTVMNFYYYLFEW